MIYIYGLVDPNTNKIRYVGKTQNLDERFQAHFRPSILKPRTRKNNWIKSLIWKNQKPRLVILEMTTKENWQEREQYWIAHLRKLNYKLTNSTDGGEGMLNATEDLRRRLSLAHMGNTARLGKSFPHSEQSRKKIGDALRGKPKSYEHIRKLSGENSPHSKLTWEQVEEIRRKHKIDKIRNQDLSSSYKISPSQITGIIQNRYWRK